MVQIFKNIKIWIFLFILTIRKPCYNEFVKPISKICFIVFFIVCCCSAIFADSLETFQLSHPVYDEVEALYVMEGKSSPMGAKPWTHEDVRRLLENVIPSTNGARDLWTHINNYLNSDDGFIFNAVLEPQLMIHSNESFKGNKEIISSEKLDRQFAVLGFGYNYKDNLSLYMDASIGVAPSDVHTVDPSTLKSNNEVSKRLSSIWGTNIPFLPDGFNIMNFPNNAYLAVGNRAIRAISGRGQVEWGNGTLGNMIIGNTLPYHDYFSLTFTGSDKFSYQLLSSFFSHSINKENSTNDRKPLNGLRFFLGHRFEFTLLQGKLFLAINDAMMYQSKDNYLDLRILNPMFFLHNGYMAGNSNSLASLEIEYSPIKNLSLYAQFALDDYAVFGEPKPGEAGASADGLAAMLGVRAFIPVSSSSYSYGVAEFVYTSPFMYHRAMEHEDIYIRELYFVSSTRYMTGSQSFLERYLSFPFGSDALAGILKFGYKKLDVFDISTSIFLMAHGVIDEFSTITQYHGGEQITNTPSTTNPFAPTESKGGKAEYTVIPSINLSYYIKPWLPLNIGVDLICIWNKENYSAPVVYDLQLNLGLSIKY